MYSRFQNESRIIIAFLFVMLVKIKETCGNDHQVVANVTF